MNCPNCGIDIRQDSLFCHQCGFSLEFQAKDREIGEFWKWFENNEEHLYTYKFEEGAAEIIDLVDKQITLIDDDLVFEFSANLEGKREFVISAGGIRKLIPVVQRIVEAAPDLPRWEIIPFRQRRESFHSVRFQDGSRLEPESIIVSLEPDRGRIGITIFIEGLSKKNYNTYGQIGFLMLDQALGEYDVMTKVGFVEFKKMSKKSKITIYPITEMAKPFDDMYKRIAGDENYEFRT